MPLVPVLSLLVPMAGVLVLLGLASVPRLRPWLRFVVPVTATLCLIVVLAAPLEAVRPVVLSRWWPSAFFGSSLTLQADPQVWSLVLAVCCAAAGAALVQLSRRAQPGFIVGLSSLGMLAAMLVSLWGANLLTVMVGWGAFDLAWVLGMIAAGASAGRIALGGGAGLLSTMVLWAGALVVGGGGGSQWWHLLSADGLGRDLLAVAGVLRLGLYPLHMAVPTGLRRAVPGAGSALSAPLLGWGLLLRLVVAVGEGALLEVGWLPWLGMVSLVAGGVLAWTRRGAGEALSWATLAATGTVLWGVTAAGDHVPLVLAAGASSWVLGVALVYLGRGLERTAPWWTVGSLVGAMTLLGVPLTPAFVVVLSALGSGSLTVGTAVLFLVGQAFLTAGLARQVLRAAVPEEGHDPREVAARAAGLAVVVLPLVAGGLHPPLLYSGVGAPALTGLVSGAVVLPTVLWLVGVGAGVALFWQGRRYRERLQPALSLLHDLASLDWLLRLLLGALGRAVRFFRATAELMEGAGAVLWALAVFLLLLLAGLGR